MSGIIFFICSTSAISSPLVALRIPAWQAAPKQRRQGCGNKRKKKWQKSKSTATNLSSHFPTRFSSAKSLIASKSPGILIATGKPESRMRRNSKPRRSVEFSSATARCTRWRVNGQSQGETCRCKKRNQEMWTFPNLKLGVRKMWQGKRLLIKQLRWNPMHPVNQTARSQSWKDRVVTQATCVSSHSS